MKKGETWEIINFGSMYISGTEIGDLYTMFSLEFLLIGDVVLRSVKDKRFLTLRYDYFIKHFKKVY